MDRNSKNLLEMLDLLGAGEISTILKQSKKLSEKDVLADRVVKIAKELSHQLHVLNGISEGDFKRKLSPFTHRDEVSSAISSVAESIASTAKVASDVKMALEQEKIKLLQEDWVKSQYTSIFSKIQGITSLEDLGRIVLSELSFALNVHLGAFYIAGSDDGVVNSTNAGEKLGTLELVATYGLQASPDRKKNFNIGEGIVGQCALDHRPRFLNEVPIDYVEIESGLGHVRPKCIVVMPILTQEKLCGVIELASLHQLDEIQKRLLIQITNSVGITIRSISDNNLTKNLLDEIAKKNNSLASQKLALDYSAIVAETDIRGRITYVNDKFLEISKYNQEELIGQDHRILNSKSHPKEFFVNLWKTIAKGEVWHGEVKNKAKDGSHYWVDTTIYPVKDEQGRLCKYVAIRFDITDKKRALEELQLATRQAKKAADIKTEFLANMSHEIRTPMNAIIGMAELLAETSLDVDQMRYVDILNNAGKSLLGVINNILDLSKIESGNLVLEDIPFDLESIVCSTSEIMCGSAHKKGLELITSIAPSVETQVSGDPNRIHQVIINLIGNAIKFTKNGEVILRVEQNPEKPDHTLFTVTDTGVGIPADVINKLFQNFSQANSSTTREYGGTGLGLAISKKIVEMMGGFIGVRSEEGKGSSFFFSIPIKRSVDKKQEMQDVVQFPNLVALVIDHNASTRKAISEMLASINITSTDVESAAQALKLVASNKYDLIFVDHHLPDMDSVILCQDLAKTVDHAPIFSLLLNADDKETDLGNLAGIGVDFCLKKPIRRSELYRSIDGILSRRLNRPTVLVVDDDQENRDYMSSLIETLDFRVLKVGSGNDALKALTSTSVDAVVSDILMPEIDGIQLFEKAREQGVTTPFTFVSGVLDDKVSKRLSSHGIEKYFGKPFKGEELLDLVENQIKRDFTSKPLVTRSADLTKEITLDSLKILVVDDFQVNRDIIKCYLEKQPCILDFACDGEEAVSKFSSRSYDLIFMDIQMPRMDGHEATRKIREVESQQNLTRTPIISLSAHAFNEEIQKSLESGADAYLTKPIRKRVFLEMVDKFSHAKQQGSQTSGSSTRKVA